jgi:hypothetical protein
MKSGTNQYHGSAYDYMVNEATNAGLPYTNGGDVRQQRCCTQLQAPRLLLQRIPPGPSVPAVRTS